MTHLIAEYGDAGQLQALINFIKIHAGSWQPPRSWWQQNRASIGTAGSASGAELLVHACLNRTNHLRQTPLMFSAYHGRDEVVRILMKNVSAVRIRLWHRHQTAHCRHCMPMGLVGVQEPQRTCSRMGGTRSRTVLRHHAYLHRAGEHGGAQAHGHCFHYRKSLFFKPPSHVLLRVRTRGHKTAVARRQRCTTRAASGTPCACALCWTT